MDIDKASLEFSKIQEDLKTKINIKYSINEEDIKLIAGIDLAYWNESEVEKAVCSVIVLDYASKKVIEKVYSVGEIKVPYIAGYLAFRELPLIIETIKKLNSIPDLFMFDGNGYLHPNHMGIATHASFSLNKPTIGVAKKYLRINNTDYTMPENRASAYTDIIIKNEVYGRVLRTKNDVKPIFISCGNYIDLDSATKIVMHCINKESHIPIPTRLADLETHILRKSLISPQA